MPRGLHLRTRLRGGEIDIGLLVAGQRLFLQSACDVVGEHGRELRIAFCMRSTTCAGHFQDDAVGQGHRVAPFRAIDDLEAEVDPRLFGVWEVELVLAGPGFSPMALTRACIAAVSDRAESAWDRFPESPC